MNAQIDYDLHVEVYEPKNIINQSLNELKNNISLIEAAKQATTNNDIWFLLHQYEIDYNVRIEYLIFNQ